MLQSFSPRHLLRQSVPTRLVIVAAILTPLWLSIFWAVLLS